MSVLSRTSLFEYAFRIRLFLAGAIVLLVVGVSTPEAYAQKKTEYEKVQDKKNKGNRRWNRRGDKGESNRAKLRNTRFKIRSKQGEKAYKGDITGRKFSEKRSSRPNWGARIANPNPYAGRKRTSEASRAKASKQTPRYSTRQGEKAWKGSAGGRDLSGRSVRTTFTGKKAYSRGAGSGRSATRDPERPRRVTRITPRSASGAYRVRKREKPYAIRERSKWESAYKGDITGKKFRAKSASQKPIIQKPKPVKFTSQGGRRGDRAYKGQMTAGYKSASRTKEKAWKNDISGTKLRQRTSERPNFKTRGGGFRSASSRKETAGSRSPMGRPPGAGTQRGLRFQGNIKSGKAIKGGGSASGRRWNNKGRAVEGRGIRAQDSRTARYQGNFKGGRLLSGGGSKSGRRWNNNGRAVQGRGPRDQDNRVARFQGNLKGGKLIRGGGSASGKRWNNNGKAVQGRGPRDQDNRVARFQGNLKGGKPFKGGGSKNRSGWNNKEKPVQGRGPKDQDNRIVRFQGNIKGGKPLKGGGSIDRSGWNNKEKAVQAREPRSQDDRIVKYNGNVKTDRGKASRERAHRAATHKGEKLYYHMTEKGPDDEHRYSGNIKQFDYKKNDNSADEALKVRPPGKRYYKKPPYQGNIKIKSDIKKNKAADEEALAKKYPTKEYFKGGKYQGTIKKNWETKHNPSSADDALDTRPRTAAVVKATKYQGRLKMPHYEKNSKAADDALKGIGPSRAAIQASAYQGNIKMKKKRVEDRHPDFKYLQMQSNGKAEKDKVFSFKLMWSKLFKKSENQPDNLKEKEKRPRYDKREREIWND